MNLALDKILADLERHKHLFDLDRDDLGRKLGKAFTDGVQECIAGQHDPDGQGWEYLSPAYEEWKGFQFPGNPIGVLHQTMADPHEVAGEMTTLTATQATVTYGITEQAKQEAQWFQEGDAHQPPRRFWGFTPDSLDEVKKLLDERFATV
jgi:Phage virion morphogenesis family